MFDQPPPLHSIADQPTVVAATTTTTVTSAGGEGIGNKASDLHATNEPDSDDDDLDAEPADVDDDDEEVEYDEEEEASDDEESEVDQLTDEAPEEAKSIAPAASVKRDSIASSTTSSSSSTKSSPKAQQQTTPSRNKQSQAKDQSTFKTRVFTNKAVPSRNGNGKQPQKNPSQQQRKNSNELIKLKGSVLLIEEMYQPVTRKSSTTKLQKAAKKESKEQVTSTNPSSSSDETTNSVTSSKSKSKASKSSNFSEPSSTASTTTTSTDNVSKNWSRKSQTFTGATSTSASSSAVNGPTTSASAIKSGLGPFERDSKSSPQRTATPKKSKPSELREVASGGGLASQVSMAAGQSHLTGKKSSTTTLHQYKKLNLSDEELVRYLHHYLLDVDSLKLLGFPVECEWSSDRAVIYKPTASEFYSMRQQQRQPTDLFTPAAPSVPRIPVTVEKRVEEEEDLVDDGIVTDELDLKLTNDEEDDDESGEESQSKARRRKRRSPLDRLSSVKLLSSSPPSSSSGNSSGIEDSSESTLSLPGSPSSARLSPPTIEAIPTADEKKCSRCGRGFFVTVDGEYLTQEHCVYHYGRVQRVLNATDNSFSFEYSCCAASPDTKGCTTHKLHVWSGLSEGCNGPYRGFISTTKDAVNSARKNKSKVKRKLSDGPSFVFCADLDHLEGVEERKRTATPTTINSKQRASKTVKVYALDCEMCFTGRGLELAKVTVVAHDGGLVYEKFVQPESEIIDFNTRFSGIKPSDFHSTNRSNIRSIQEVQRDLVEFIEEDTILIGHGLENDLRALKLIHKRVIDTSIAFPHFSGLPFRRSLKSLTKSILKRDIQMAQTGHDSYEDSLACVELMLWRVRKDFRTSHGNNSSAGYQQQQHQMQPMTTTKRYHGNTNGTSASGVRWS